MSGDVLHQQHLQLVLGEPPAGSQRSEETQRASGPPNSSIAMATESPTDKPPAPPRDPGPDVPYSHGLHVLDEQTLRPQPVLVLLHVQQSAVRLLQTQRRAVLIQPGPGHGSLYIVHLEAPPLYSRASGSNRTACRCKTGSGTAACPRPIGRLEETGTESQLRRSHDSESTMRGRTSLLRENLLRVLQQKHTHVRDTHVPPPETACRQWAWSLNAPS